MSPPRKSPALLVGGRGEALSSRWSSGDYTRNELKTLRLRKRFGLTEIQARAGEQNGLGDFGRA